MKQYLVIGTPFIALTLIALAAVTGVSVQPPRPEPVRHASLSEAEMQRIAVMMNEIEPQAH